MKTRSLLLTVLAGMVIVVGLLLAYDNLVFRLKSTDPRPEQVATTASYVDFNFSQPIKQIGSATITTKENTTTQGTTINGRTVRVQLPNPLTANQVYVIHLKQVQSQWLNNSIADLPYTFTPTYQDFNTLSPDQQKASVDKSNSGQIDDPFLNNYFPLRDPDGNFMIEAVNEGDGKTISVDITFLAEVYSPDTGTKAQLPADQAEALRTKALQMIKDNHGNPDKYLIRYSNDYLNQKYSKDTD